MSGRDDDLDEWRDDPLVRALRAPGTVSELAGEQEMVAAYRRAVPVRSLRRVVGRLGVGGTAVVASVALSSGVAAAAYTRTLPEPVQRIAHNVFGPVGVPAAPVAEPKVRIKTRPPVSSPTPTRTPLPTSTPAPTQTPRSTPKPVRTPTGGASVLIPLPSGTPAPSPAPSETPTPSTSPTPSLTPTPTPTTSPTPTPTSTPTPTPTGPVVARVSITPGFSSVPVGSSVSVYGDVQDAGGSALRGRKVRLMTRLPGEPTWTRVADGLTGRDGSITLTTPTLAQNTVVQLRSGTVRSVGTKVVVVPTVTASVTETTLSVSTAGGLPGDQVALLHWRDGVLVQVSKAPLGSEGSTSFKVEPPGERTVRYVVRLLKTKQHAAARTGVTVPNGQ